MKKLLLTTTAIASLIAVHSLASAQTQGGGGGSAPAATQAAPSGGSGGAGAGSAGSARESGSGAASGSSDAPRGGSAGRDAAESPRQGQTTGQSRDRDQSPSAQREGQRDQGQRDQGQRGQTQQRQGQSGEGASDRPGRADQQRDRTGQGGRETTGAAPSGSAAISTEQRTKIKEHKSSFRAGRVTNVNFQVSVGATVPRSVTLFALPPTIIEVVPAWRSYRYVMVEDEIIIIDPTTFRIFAVIDA